jgi:orotate phosphoribosyltransferase
MTDPSRQRLLELFRSRALLFGKFTLASGRQSSYYINSKRALFHSECAALLGDALYELTKDLDVQAVGGPEVGALPLATATVVRYHRAGRPMEGFFVRKQAKGHGSRERIEGVLEAGWRVAVLDDVLTTGGSARQAVEEVERAGARVAAVVCVVDRLQGARESFEPRYPFRSVFTIRDFGIEPEGGTEGG